MSARPRQFTRDEAIARAEQLNRENTVLMIALTLSTTGSPNATEIAYHETSRYVFRLFGAARCDGGIVTTTFHARGQKPSVTAHYLDDLTRTWRDHIDSRTEAGAIQSALTRLQSKRDRIQDMTYKICSNTVPLMTDPERQGDERLRTVDTEPGVRRYMRKVRRAAS
jgi:hypothetical protein